MSLLNEGFEEIFGTKFNIEFRTPANAPKKSKPSAAASITTSAATAPLLQSPDSSSYEYTFDTLLSARQISLLMQPVLQLQQIRHMPTTPSFFTETRD